MGVTRHAGNFHHAAIANAGRDGAVHRMRRAIGRHVAPAGQMPEHRLRRLWSLSADESLKPLGRRSLRPARHSFRDGKPALPVGRENMRDALHLVRPVQRAGPNCGDARPGRGGVVDAGMTRAANPLSLDCARRADLSLEADDRPRNRNAVLRNEGALAESATAPTLALMAVARIGPRQYLQCEAVTNLPAIAPTRKRHRKPQPSEKRRSPSPGIFHVCPSKSMLAK